MAQIADARSQLLADVLLEVLDVGDRPDQVELQAGTAGGLDREQLSRRVLPSRTTLLGIVKHLILVDAKAPVSFFAYPGKNSYLVPEGCQVHELASPSSNVVASLDGLAEALGATAATAELQQPSRPERPTGELTGESVCQAIGAALPEGAIVSDESQTSGVTLPASTAGAPHHDWLALTGGAIGQGLPVAVGAAVASPDRPVYALEADGSALYTIQSLWPMAHEQLTVTVYRYEPGCAWETHSHPEDQVTYIAEGGTVEFVVDGRPTPLSPGQLAVLPGGMPHSASVPTDGQRVVSINVWRLRSA